MIRGIWRGPNASERRLIDRSHGGSEIGQDWTRILEIGGSNRLSQVGLYLGRYLLGMQAWKETRRGFGNVKGQQGAV